MVMLKDEDIDADVLLPPIIGVTLPNIPGGEDNLLPSGAWNADLLVEFVQWLNSHPSPGNPEHLQLYWGATLVEEKSWEVYPIPADELYIRVPKSYLIEGAHALSYRVMTVNGEWSDSSPMTVTIDKTAPVLSSSDMGRLVFPLEVIEDGITEHYLSAHSDQVLAQVPEWDAPKPGDVITWYWSDNVAGTDLEAGTVTLVEGDRAPFTVAFQGDLIRDYGDGQRFASYIVKDRAGNVSPLALAVELKADTAPVPRVLPWPVIEEAAGTGVTMTLMPEDAQQGVVVRVPDTAVIYPGEALWVQWGDPAAPGSYRADTPMTPGGRRFRIPMAFVAAHIGASLSVCYQVDDGRLIWTSDLRNLNILSLPLAHLPTIQCPDALGQEFLDLSQLPSTGARLQLARWSMITTDQCVSFKVTGVTTTGTATEHLALDKHRVTASELTAGIGASGNITVPKSFLDTLRRNTKFSLKVFVTFAMESVCPPPGDLPNFPVSELTLID